MDSSVDIWVDLQNHHRKRRDHTISTPTACTPYFAYSTPEYFGSTNHLVSVPSDRIQFLLQRDYPDIEAMFTHTPGWFHEVAVAIMAALEIDLEHITIGNVWHVFSRMLPSIQLHFQQHEYPELSPQRSEESQASEEGED